MRKTGWSTDSTLRDVFGNKLRVWISDAEGNPHRHCLRMTRPGDRLILFAYRPFTTSGTYAERPGPMPVLGAAYHLLSRPKRRLPGASLPGEQSRYGGR